MSGSSSILKVLQDKAVKFTEIDAGQCHKAAAADSPAAVAGNSETLNGAPTTAAVTLAPGIFASPKP